MLTNAARTEHRLPAIGAAGQLESMIPLGIGSILEVDGSAASEKLCPDLPVALLCATHDAARPLVSANTAAAALLRYETPADIRSILLSQLFVNPDAHAEICSDLFALSLRESHRECELRRSDGTRIWASVHARLQRQCDDRDPLVVLALEDISASRLVQATLVKTEERFRSMTLELSLTEERERRRLSGYLHDEVAQLIALARMKMSLLHAAPGSPERDAEAIEVQSVLDRAMTATRCLMFQLSHPALYDLGLLAGAHWLIEDFKQLYGVDVQVIHDGQPVPLDLRLRVVLYQCLRELLVNAAKHAGVRVAQVEIETNAKSVRLTVSDAGVGCAANVMATDRARGRGFGLFSIHERIHGLGGTMDFCSAPGKGTTVKLEVPLSCT